MPNVFRCWQIIETYNPLKNLLVFSFFQPITIEKEDPAAKEEKATIAQDAANEVKEDEEEKPAVRTSSRVSQLSDMCVCVLSIIKSLATSGDALNK